MKIFSAQTIHNKKELNKEIKDKYGNFKEDCFPTPSGGCNCVESDAAGNRVVNKYDDSVQCKIPQVCYKLPVEANGNYIANKYILSSKFAKFLFL